MRLAEKVAVVVGVGGPLGRAVALGVAREGASVLACDADGAAAAAVATEIIALGGVSTSFILDVTEKASVEHCASQISEAYPTVDLLVNTGELPEEVAFLSIDEEDLDLALRQGLIGYFLTSQIFGRAMADRRSGRIVNVSSIDGRAGSAGAVARGLVAGGVGAMTRAFGQGLGMYGVHVNAVMVGPMSTTRATEAEESERKRRLPFARLANAEDAVGAVLFLLSDEADFVVGEEIFVDGGFTTAAVTDEPYRPEWAKAK